MSAPKCIWCCFPKPKWTAMSVLDQEYQVICISMFNFFLLKISLMDQVYKLCNIHDHKYNSVIIYLCFYRVFKNNHQILKHYYKLKYKYKCYRDTRWGLKGRSTKVICTPRTGIEYKRRDGILHIDWLKMAYQPRECIFIDARLILLWEAAKGICRIGFSAKNTLLITLLAENSFSF